MVIVNKDHVWSSMGNGNTGPDCKTAYLSLELCTLQVGGPHRVEEAHSAVTQVRAPPLRGNQVIKLYVLTVHTQSTGFMTLQYTASRSMYVG